ncbi:hypothetical protein [Sphingobacterium litopenaei]|uniref:ABC transporter permease n=1 Tax=Sphingobacterium litopenaei TaxID=2763500 RepID=A0ABR7YG78_9SPHI|nr:hypothetical protein [Sphingobacterium litopenaei]MBD1430228.1 hypothetical protein [Sphingobacterium litopenaei]
MNNTFDFNRFKLLVGRQWQSYKKEYFLIVGVLLAIILYFYGNEFYKVFKVGDMDIYNNDFRFRIPLFIIFGLLYISLTASSYFKNYGKSNAAIAEILVPASKFEKFLAGIFYTTGLGFVTYLLLFHIVDFGFMNYVRSFTTSTTTYVENGKEIVRDNLPYLHKIIYIDPVKYFVFLPFTINALFLLGSIYFKNKHFIKTIVSVAVYAGLCFFLIYSIYRLFFLGHMQLEENDYIDNKKLMLFLFAVLGWTITIILWAITYVRLKEKEA